MLYAFYTLLGILAVVGLRALYDLLGATVWHLIVGYRLERDQVCSRLSEMLSEYSSMPYSTLAALLGKVPHLRSLDFGSEKIEVEVQVNEDERHSGRLRIAAAVLGGPETWRFERIVE